MIAGNSSDLAQMLQDDTFIQPIELRDTQYELDNVNATIGKRIVGSHAYRCVLNLHGTLDLRGRFYFDNVRFRIAPNVRGVNAAWGAHSVFTDCFFVSADEKNFGAVGLYSDETADNNNSYGVNIIRCSFYQLQIGLQIQLGANHIVGGWVIRDTDFSSCRDWGLHVRGAGGLYLDNVLFQVNGHDAYLHGTEIMLVHCHAERQQNPEKISVIIDKESYEVLILGGGIAAREGRIQDWSGKAKILAPQESKAMLKRTPGA